MRMPPFSRGSHARGTGYSAGCDLAIENFFSAQLKRVMIEPISNSANASFLRATRMIGAHLTLGADFLHRRFEITMDLRIFVLELDLPATQLNAGESPALAILGAHETKAPVVPTQR